LALIGVVFVALGIWKVSTQADAASRAFYVVFIAIAFFFIVLSVTRLPTSVELIGSTLAVRQMFSCRRFEVAEVTRVICPRAGAVTIRAEGQRAVTMLQPVIRLDEFFDAFERVQPYVDIEQPSF
jgi:hypothetical protein